MSARAAASSSVSRRVIRAPGTSPVVVLIWITRAVELVFLFSPSCMPLPRPTSRITAAIPIVMPTAVNAVRSLEVRVVRKAITTVSRAFIGLRLLGYRYSGDGDSDNDGGTGGSLVPECFDRAQPGGPQRG